MTPPFVRSRMGLAALALTAPLLHGPSTAWAADQETSPTTLPVPNPWRLHTDRPIRLGDWLASAGPRAQAYDWGLMWLSAQEVPRQQALKTRVQAAIQQQARTGHLSPAAAHALTAYLGGLAVTGRLPLPTQDARLMQANPRLEPMAAAGDSLLLTPYPDTVTVLRDDGQRCELRWRSGLNVADYLQRCSAHTTQHSTNTDTDNSASSGTVDTVWLVQPDGQHRAVGIAPWNASATHDVGEAPAPGAWLWAPSRAARWTEADNRLIADWLATQGPAGLGDTGAAARSSANTTTAAAETPPGTDSTATALPPIPAGPPLSASDWGITGLLQTPSARTRPAGHLGLTFSRTWPYTQSTATLSPWEGLEIGVRYTNISTQLYGAEIAGDQSYKDKSLDVKVRLHEEDAVWPEVAVGLRDPGGTGLFAGEYLVGSKRWGAFDLSLGLGWGYLGGRANLANPLSWLGSRFDQRASATVGQGGTAHLGALFTGRTAVFGGVQWQTPWQPLVLKLELDGNDYRHEPFGTTLPNRSPLNVGAVWQQGPLSLSAGLSRGQQWSLGLSLQTALDKVSTPKTALPRPVPVQEHPALLEPALTAFNPSTAAAPPTGEAAETLRRTVAEHLGWSVAGLGVDGSDWVVHLDEARGFYLRERLERGAAVLHAAAPDSVRGFRFVMRSRELPVTQIRVDRAVWMAQQTRWIPPTQQQEAWQRADAQAITAPQERAPTPPSPRSINLGYQHNIGGPDGYLYALSLRAAGQWRLGAGLWGHATAEARVLDNYNHFHYTAPSALPRVRTYLREYLTTQRLTVPNAQINHLQRWSDNTWSLAYAGLLESMFAGAGAEVMWRPPGSPWAWGLDLNVVRQREFDQRLSLRDYRVTTGHLTGYWDTGWHDLVAQVSAGQYLAGDRGVTVDLARVFANGARIGAWITKTNVSAERFGEGSFDKGLYFSLPFDALVSAWSGSSFGMAWQPLIRDGGARLQRAQTLWGLTQARDVQALRYRSALRD